MYEVTRHEKDLEENLLETKKSVDAGVIEGILVIRITKNERDVKVTAVLGRVSQFEWLGSIEYAKDIIKAHFQDAADGIEEE